MKKAINIRLEENILLVLEQLSKDLHTTKTDIIEKSIHQFSKQNSKKQNDLLQFAGIIGNNEADMILTNIKDDRLSKDFSVDM